MLLKKLKILSFSLLILCLSTSRALGYSVGGESGWQYRRSITISPQTPEANFQVRVELTTSTFDYSECRSDGYDIRFTEDSSGSTVLDYWRETWNASGTSKFFVEVQTSGASAIYMFYGNNSASTDLSDGSATFLYFDNFEDGTLDNWTIVHQHGTWSAATDQKKNGFYSMKGTTPGSGGGNVNSIAFTNSNETDVYYRGWVRSNRPCCVSDCAMVVRVGDNQWTGYTHNSYSSESPNNYGGTWKGNGASGWTFIQKGNGADTYDKDTWQLFETTIVGTTINTWLDGTQILSNVNVGSDYTSGKLGVQFWADSGYPQTVWYDDIAVAKCANPQPTCTLSIDFDYKKPITIYASKVACNVNNFPVLIYLASDSDLASKAQDDGDDIIFRDASDNALSHEIEEFDGSTGKLVAWVKSDLSASSNTTIWMIYGNSYCASQQDADGVWDDNYKMVLHLAETGTGTRYDSTQYSNNGSPQNYDGDEATSTGKISGADIFDGSNDYLALQSAVTNGIEHFTFSFWIKTTENGHDDTWWRNPSMIGQSTSGAGSRDFIINSDYGKIGLTGGLGGGDDYFFSNTSINDNSWHYICAINDDSNIKLYVDNSYINQIPSGNTMNSTAFWLAALNGESQGHYHSGTYDELRISNTNRTTCWLETEYNNQSDPSSFFNVGDEQTVIDLSYFRARAVNSAVLLEWKTYAEIDNEGFNIFKSENSSTGYFQVNHYLIPSKGIGGLGAKYNYTDSSIINGLTYYYMLEAVDIYGQSSFHGPASAIPHDITLVWPMEEEAIAVDSCFFCWRSNQFSSFKVDISSCDSFPSTETLSFPRSVWTSAQHLWFPPGVLERLFKWAKINGGRLFWHVRARNKDGNTVCSESWQLVFLRPPHLQNLKRKTQNQERRKKRLPRR